MRLYRIATPNVPPNGLGDLLPVRMAVHEGWVFVGVPGDLSRGKDHGDPRGPAFWPISLGQGIDPIELTGAQEGRERALEKVCSGLQVPGVLLVKKPLEGPGGEPRGGAKGEDDDQDVGGKELPEQPSLGCHRQVTP